MASNKRIKGITIDISGETKGLDKALQNVNKRSRDLQSELRDVERLLKFDPGNVEAITQKQKLLTDQVELTAERLETLRKAEQKVQEEVKKGKVSEKQYRDFRREIEFTEGSLKNLKDQLSKVNKNSGIKDIKRDAEQAKEAVNDLGSEIGGVLGGLAAGGGIAGSVGQALDSSTLSTKIDITFDVPKESKGTIKSAVRDIEAYGVDAESALEGVRRQWALNADASDETNKKIIDGAGTIASAYSGIDFTELIQETNEISSELGITNEEALGLTNSLLKVGFPPEQLDIIAEYGKQLSDAGFNAEEVQAIMAAGVDTGTWNIDNLLDGLKEGRIKLAEFGEEVPKATAELLEKTDISKKQLQEWGEAVAQGGETGRQAMEEVALALLQVEDDTTRNALGVQFFGTMWEDQGTNITDTILNMDEYLVTAKDNQDLLNDSVSAMDSSPAVQMQQAMGDLKTAMEPLFTVIADIISKIAEWISENPTLAGTITAIVTVIGILVGIGMALAPIFLTLAALAAALGVSVGAVAIPFLIAIGVIAAIIAIGVLLWKNWDTIMEKAKKLASWIGKKFGELKDSAVDKMEETKDKIEDVWDKVEGFFKGISLKQIGKDIIQGLIDGVSSMAGKIGSKVKEIADSIPEGIKKFLGIHSPSRVTMKLGEYTGEGLAKGIENSIGQISNMADKMSDAAVPEIPSGYSKNNQTRTTSNSLGVRQPAIIQVVTPDKREMARWIVDDLTDLQQFKLNRFEGR